MVRISIAMGSGPYRGSMSGANLHHIGSPRHAAARNRLEARLGRSFSSGARPGRVDAELGSDDAELLARRVEGFEPAIEMLFGVRGHVARAEHGLLGGHAGGNERVRVDTVYVEELFP